MTKDKFFEQLWERIAQQGDFPMLQCSIDRLTDTLRSDANAATLAASVLSDFSLSQKVIRLANSAMYSSFGGEVTTVSRAIMVLGVDTVAHLALSVQLLDHFAGAASKQPVAAQELKRAMLAGEVARTLSATQDIKFAEEAVVCSLMQQLSRLAVVFYFPVEWQAMLSLCQDGLEPGDVECASVVGATFKEIGQEFVTKWRLPQSIASVMLADPVDSEELPNGRDGWLQALSGTASKAAAMLSSGKDPAELEQFLKDKAVVLGLDEDQVGQTFQTVAQFHKTLEAKQPTVKREALPGKPADAAEMLAKKHRELNDISTSATVSELAPLVVESLMRSFNFSNCFLLLYNPASKSYIGRIGFGPRAQAALPKLKFHEEFEPDFFHFATTTRKPLYLEDVKRAEVSTRVPAWFKQAFPDARSVFITGLFLNTRCLAVVCGDWGANVCAVPLSATELRNSALLTGELELAFQRSATPAPRAVAA